jgi:hypothetical protein
MNDRTSAPIEPPFVLQVEDLRRVVNLILDHILIDVNVRSVEINSENNLYWEIGEPTRYNMENPNPQSDEVGSLADDWHFLSKVESREEAVSLLLIHAAPLLRYIGERVGQ